MRKITAPMTPVLYFHGFASSPASAKITALRPLLEPDGIELNTPDLNIPSFEQLDFDAIVAFARERARREPPRALGGSPMGALIALARDVSPSVNQCELTHLQPEAIDVERAIAQHEEYRALLASLGLEVVRIPADPAFPDCVFIEDTAIVLDDVAVITRPGAPSRRGETR